MRISFCGSILCLFVAVGCGSPSEMVNPATDDAGGDQAQPQSSPDLSPLADMTPGVPPPPLPLLDPHSKTVIASPQVVTITFPGYKYKSHVESFGDFVVKSNWLMNTGAEYGVGLGKHLQKVVMPMAAPGSLSDSMLSQMLKDAFTAGTIIAPMDTLSANAYLVYFPNSSVITDDRGRGDTLCNQYEGYHHNDIYMGHRFAYSVIGDCKLGKDDVTGTASHELIEMATDPFNSPRDGLFLDPATTDPWIISFGQEVADLCENEPNAYEGNYAVARSYSNAIAMAGTGDPCIPDPIAPYTNVAVTPVDMPTVAAGASVTFTLTGWARGMANPWKVTLASASNSDINFQDMSPKLSGRSIGVGTTLTLTLTAPAGALSGAVGGVLVQSGVNNQVWPVAFSVQ